jgi:hypothetical protein
MNTYKKHGGRGSLWLTSYPNQDTFSSPSREFSAMNPDRPAGVDPRFRPRDAVSAEYGPVPIDLLVEYLRALEKIGVVTQVL